MGCYTEMRKNRAYKQDSCRHREHLVNTARLNGTYCIMTFTKAQKTGQTNAQGQREGQQVSLGGGTDLKGGKGTFG